MRYLCRQFLGLTVMLHALVALSALPAVQAQEYEVLPHAHSGPRGRLWIADGLAHVTADEVSVGNRFRLGADLLLGPNHRFTLGLTVIDAIASAESSEEVGEVVRSSSGFTLGYFLVPDRLRLAYTFNMHTLQGSRVSGGVSVNGHQLALESRLVAWDNVNLSADLSYLYLPSVSVPVLDTTSGAVANARYPSAQIWTLGLILGFDFY